MNFHLEEPEQLAVEEPTHSAADALMPLQQDIADLVKNNVDRFDPFRFRYIESLARRVTELRQSVALAVEQKAMQALHQYQHDFVQARDAAALVMDRVASQFPHSAEKIAMLFDTCNFKEMQRVESRLNRNKRQSMLVDLTADVITGERDSLQNPRDVSLDSLLRQQEYEAIQQFSDPAVDMNGPQLLNKGELRATQIFRETWGKQSTDKLVKRSISESPEAPGPLNPHMLVVRSLSIMRGISPSYLNRFISYTNTLLWLERAGEEAETPAPKKKAKAASKSQAQKTER